LAGLIVFTAQGALSAQPEFITAAVKAPEKIGIPVKTAGLDQFIIGPDATGKEERIYIKVQSGGPLYLLRVNPDTGQCETFNDQFNGQAGIPQCLVLGPDGYIYMGTICGAHLLRLDPKTGIVTDLGKPVETGINIWSITVAPDGKAYGGVFPGAHLFVYDPKSGASKDIGTVCEGQDYLYVAADKEGKIYCGAGFTQAHLIVYDPKSGALRDILPEKYHITSTVGVGSVIFRDNIQVEAPGGKAFFYLAATNQSFWIEDEKLVPRENSRTYPMLKDGRTIFPVLIPGTWTHDDQSLLITQPKTGESRVLRFDYDGPGQVVFLIRKGPDGKIYGSSALPIHLFRYDPKTGKLEDLGNPTRTSGEIYSMLSYRGKLYICAYIGACFSVYDPAKPWRFGADKDANPRDFGPQGDKGGCRPFDMIVGKDGMIYIASSPDYGYSGGSLIRFDPEKETFKYWRNVVQDQSLFSLTLDPSSHNLWIGSAIPGGKRKEARLCLWDVDRENKIYETLPVSGAIAIRSLVTVPGGLIFGLVATGPPESAPYGTGGKMFVFDPGIRKVIHTAELPNYPGETRSLEIGPAGLIYSIVAGKLLAIDPIDYSINTVFEYPGMNCGPVFEGNDIYFGAGVTLLRYRLPAVNLVPENNGSEPKF